MKKIFKTCSNKGGVYQIYNIVNRKVYIGSAKNFKKRVYQHQTQLRNNKHQNKHLQASWNKWGEGSFLFEVLEVVEGDRTARTKTDQKYVNLYFDKWDLCYNCKKNVVFGFTTWSKNKTTTRKKKSENQKKLWTDPVYRKKMLAARFNKQNKHTEETKKKISKANLGKTRNEKQKENISKGRQNKGTRKYMFVDPIGQIVEVTNLKQFCFENNLVVDCMRHLYYGKRKTYQKWKAISPYNYKR
jgi:group I intron endonuclease